MRVRIGVLDVVGDGFLQMFRRAETKCSRVADVQLDQRSAFRFKLMRSTGKLPTDFVTDFVEAGAGTDGKERHVLTLLI